MNSSSRDHAHTATGATPDGAATEGMASAMWDAYWLRALPDVPKPFSAQPGTVQETFCVLARAASAFMAGTAAQVPADKSREAK